MRRPRGFGRRLTAPALVSIWVAQSGVSHPELLIDALAFGATDCAFCHVTAAGGHGLNERGTWLQERKLDRQTDLVDVAWLEDRETGEPTSQTSRGIPTEAKGPKPEDTAVVLQTTPSDKPLRQADYTTQWGDWPSYSGDLGASKYSHLGEISADNISRLQPVWVWESSLDRGLQRPEDRRFAADSFKGSPLVVGDLMFVRTRYSTVAAIDTATGESIWTYDPGTKEQGRPPMFGFTTRGLGYFYDEPDDQVILTSTDGWLVSLSAKTGELKESFGSEGLVDLQVGLRRHLPRTMASWSYAPTVCDGVVVVGSQTQDELYRFRGNNWRADLPVGDVRGFDADTGKQLWTFHTVPQEGEFGNETWENESWRWVGNTNVWSMTSCDPELGIAYLPVTAPSHHFYGGHRHGDNLFGTSLVAVDVKTGERIWHFQIVHHDVWDYDLPAAPVLAEMEVNGQVRKTVTQITKTAFVFVFDRVTGEPIWPIEERDVPASLLDGERVSATQPFPTWPEPFDLQGFHPSDINDVTSEIRERQIAASEKMDLELKPTAMFTPVSLNWTIVSPGIGGGGNWSGSSYDPVTRIMYVTSRSLQTLARARPTRAGQEDQRYQVNWRMAFFDGLPLTKPPWSRLTAYEMDDGSKLFAIPNGRGPVNNPLLRGYEGPDLGNLNEVPGVLVTPRLLFLGETGRPSHIKAMDKQTGEEIWRTPLEGSHTQAHPISFLVGDRQFIAIGTGSTLEPTRITAFALAPDKSNQE